MNRMKEENTKEKLSIREIFPKELEDFNRLPLMVKFRMLHFIVALVLVMGIENESLGITGCLTFNLLYAAFEAKRTYEKMKSENIVNHKTEMEENNMDDNSLNGLFSGANFQGVQIVIAQSGSKVVYKEENSSKHEVPQITEEQMVYAIEECQSLFWGQSSWAVFFCVCRDYLDMTLSMTAFENYVRELPYTKNLLYGCPDGTIQRTLSNNKYMKLHINKWETNNGMKRAILLAEKLLAELSKK